MTTLAIVLAVLAGMVLLAMLVRVLSGDGIDLVDAGWISGATLGLVLALRVIGVMP